MDLWERVEELAEKLVALNKRVEELIGIDEDKIWECDLTFRKIQEFKAEFGMLLNIKPDPNLKDENK